MMRVLVVPLNSGWEISDTKMGADTMMLPALCPVANLVDFRSLCVLLRIMFSQFSIYKERRTFR